MRVQFIGPEPERVIPVNNRAVIVKRGAFVDVPDDLGQQLVLQRVWVAEVVSAEPDPEVEVKEAEKPISRATSRSKKGKGDD